MVESTFLQTIILWTELFPKKRREKIQGENFNLSSSTVVFPQIIQELQELQSSRAILHTELILLQEFSKKYYNYKAHPVQAPSSNCSPCLQAFYMAE